MWPPRLNGEITRQGTRTPRPRGPLIPRSSVEESGSSVEEGEAVRYSPGVPGGAVGGGTWSNHPSFSSYIKNSAVFDHNVGFAVSAARTSDVKYMPLLGAEEGCSSNPRGGMIHDTLGSVPALMSATNVLGMVGPNALAYNGDAGLRKAVKYGNTWSLATITSGLAAGL